jgi:hypothetical protein
MGYAAVLHLKHMVAKGLNGTMVLFSAERFRSNVIVLGSVSSTGQ